MKRVLLAALAMAGLGGCATYDQIDGGADGGYYSGSPSYRYAYPGGYYGAYGYGLSDYGGYGGYGTWPGFYGYYSGPSYVIYPSVRRDHHGHDDDRRHDHQRPPVADGEHRRGDDHRPRTDGVHPSRPDHDDRRRWSQHDGRDLRSQGPDQRRAPDARPMSRPGESATPHWRPMPGRSTRPAPSSLQRQSQFGKRPPGQEQ